MLIKLVTRYIKSEFYTDSITANVKQPTKLWKILNDMGSTEKFGIYFVNSFYRSKNVSADAFAISPVSEDKVRASLSTLSVNKAFGLDLISSRFLRDSAGVTYSILTHIINLTIC